METRVSVVTPRLDSKPWGGSKLSHYGIDLSPGEPIGEALVTAGNAVVTGGYGGGQALDAIVRADAAQLGDIATAAVAGRAIFPLLVKLIDATQDLSIQVHPNDDQATPLDRLGKTEAWHVLEADPGAVLYLGIRPGVSLHAFRNAASRLDGSSAAMMRAIPALPGTTVLIPAGTVHALGAGVMVYEVQQPSDITYRLDDWGRVDAAGNPREMHLDAGFAVARPASIPELIEPVSLRPAIGERHLLTACRYFALERAALPTGGFVNIAHASSPSVVTVLKGEATVSGRPLAKGMSAIVWPSTEVARLTATAPLVALVCYVPNLHADIVGPALHAGAVVSDVTALGGATGDVQGALA